MLQAMMANVMPDPVVAWRRLHNESPGCYNTPYCTTPHAEYLLRNRMVGSDYSDTEVAHFTVVRNVGRKWYSRTRP